MIVKDYNKKYNGLIDILKFIFSGLIVFSHGIFLANDGEKLIFGYGLIGVEFFFVVSGYLLMNTIYSNRPSLKEYIIKRLKEYNIDPIVIDPWANKQEAKLEYGVELKDISDKDIFAINIKGLKGGHSGIEIDKKRANSNILIGRILNNLKNSDVDYDLISISGGLKNNAIPREAEAIIALDKEYVEQANDIVTSMLGIFKNEFKTSDPSIVIEMQKIDEKHERALSEQVQDKIVKVLNLMPRNIQTMSADIDGLVESSTNLGVVITENEYIKFEFATRSSVKSLKDDINERMELLCESIGVELELEDDYPEWEYAKDSKLEQICVETYEKLYNKKPEIVAIHAGLECGLLLDAIEGAQAISIGPNLFDVHTPDEHIDILSTERTWDYLVSILCNIK